MEPELFQTADYSMSVGRLLTHAKFCSLPTVQQSVTSPTRTRQAACDVTQNGSHLAKSVDILQPNSSLRNVSENICSGK